MLIIGVTGGSGSGKTYFVNQLKSQFEENEVSIIALDNYYYPKHLQQKDAQGIENFDLPPSFNINQLILDIENILQNKSISFTPYNYNNSNIKTPEITIQPAKILIIEGIFIFNFKELLPYFDLKIFIETPQKLKIKRRISRDYTERGYQKEDVLYRYKNHTIPSYKKYILPIKNQVDVIIPNTNLNYISVEMISKWCKDKTKSYFNRI